MAQTVAAGTFKRITQKNAYNLDTVIYKVQLNDLHLHVFNHTQPAGTMSQQMPVPSVVVTAAAHAKVATQYRVPLAMSHRICGNLCEV